MSKNNQSIQKEIKASVKYVRISPFKARKVANHIRSLKPEDALKALKLMPQKSSLIFYKLIHSCISNATNNFSLNSNELIIKKLVVNEGPKLKRSRARARGRILAL